MRAPTGTRIEETERLAQQVLKTIRDEVGAQNVEISIGYIGLIPSSYPINAIYQWTGGPEEFVLRVALRHESTIAVEALKERLRDQARRHDARRSVLVRAGRHRQRRDELRLADAGRGCGQRPQSGRRPCACREGRGRAQARCRSLRDLQFVQALDYPIVGVKVDREKAGLSGVSVADVARSVVAATSSSRFVVPNYWPDPKTGIGYQVQVEIPYQLMNSMNEVETIPIQRAGGDSLLLRDVAKVTEGTMPGEFDRYNMKRVVSLTANIAGEDLGRVAAHVDRAIASAGEPPKGATVEVRGQIAPFNEILRGLSIGLGVAIVVILLLLTANFQSVRLALVVMSTAPAVVAGVVVALALTRTTINLQSFMGAIMAIGVAVANAILLVTFAERHRRDDGARRGRGRRRGRIGAAAADLDDQLCHDRRHGSDVAGLDTKGASRPRPWAERSSAASRRRPWRPWSCCPASSRSCRQAPAAGRRRSTRPTPQAPDTIRSTGPPIVPSP